MFFNMLLSYVLVELSAEIPASQQYVNGKRSRVVSVMETSVYSASTPSLLLMFYLKRFVPGQEVMVR